MMRYNIEYRYNPVWAFKIYLYTKKKTEIINSKHQFSTVFTFNLPIFFTYNFYTIFVTLPLSNKENLKLFN